MTDETIRNTAEPKGAQMAESIQPGSDLAGESRRAALATLAKHAAYTAPAVLAILSLTTKRAAAFSF